MLTARKFGNKTVYCNGKLFFGSNKTQVLSTILFLVLPPCTILLFENDDNGFNSLLKSEILFMIILAMITLVLFLVIGLIDPGYISRKVNESPADEDGEKTIEYKNRLFLCTYCMTCKLHKPLRCHHCKTCGVCVEEKDHHCDWIGNCIGKRTRGLFVCFLICILSLNTYEFTLVFSNLHWDTATKWTIIKSLFCIFLIILITAINLFCSALLIVQIVLISRGVTTVEYSKKYWQGIVNPYDEGCTRNWKNFFFQSRTKRNISFDDIKYLEEENRNQDQDENQTSLSKNDILSISLEMIQNEKSLLHS